MKKLVLILSLVIASVITYGQATPTTTVRVATTATVFGVSIPVGTKVYNIATGRTYVCKTACASTGDLGTDAAKFNLESNYAAPAAPLTSGDSVAVYNRTTGQYEVKKITFGTGAGSVTSISQGTGMLNSANPITTTGTIGVDTSKVIMFNDTIGTGATGKIETKYHATTTFLPKALADGKIFIGSAGGVATAQNMTGDASITNGGVATVVSSAGDFKVKGHANLHTPNVGTSADSLLVINGGEVKRVASSLFLTTASVKTAIVQDFEKATADSAAGYCVRLSNTPLSGTIIVNYNGATIPSSKFSIVSTSKIFVALPAYQYDKMTVSYSY